MGLNESAEKMALVYAGYSEGNAEPLINLMADDGVVRYVAASESVGFVDTYKGPEGTKAAIVEIGREFEWLSFRNLELISEGDYVVGVNGGRLRHHGTGSETSIHLAVITRFENCRIVEFVEFFDSAGLADWCSGGAHPECTIMNCANKVSDVSADEVHENRSRIEDTYRAYEKGDPQPLLSLLAEDVTYNSVAKHDDLSFAGPWSGRAAFEANIARIADDYELIHFTVNNIIAQNDLVALHAQVEFTNRRTGKPARSEKLDIHHMFNGKITEFNEFFDTYSVRGANQ